MSTGRCTSGGRFPRSIPLALEWLGGKRSLLSRPRPLQPAPIAVERRLRLRLGYSTSSCLWTCLAFSSRLHQHRVHCTLNQPWQPALPPGARRSPRRSPSVLSGPSSTRGASRPWPQGRCWDPASGDPLSPGSSRTRPCPDRSVVGVHGSDEMHPRCHLHLHRPSYLGLSCRLRLPPPPSLSRLVLDPRPSTRVAIATIRAG